MQNNKTLIFACLISTLVVGVCSVADEVDAAPDKRAAQKIPSWSSPSLRNDTIVGPNGAVTTRTALLANEKWGIGDARIQRLELRNGVLVITDADAAAPSHLSLTREQLSAFVLGTRLASAEDPLNQLNRVLNRSHLMPPGAVESVMKGMKATGAFEH